MVDTNGKECWSRRRTQRLVLASLLAFWGAVVPGRSGIGRTAAGVAGAELGAVGVAVVERMDAATRKSAERIVRELAGSIRERDRITYEHSRRVATYAQRLARHMGWGRRLAYDLALAALVHDLGKTWIVNAVLHKPSALSTDERLDMERHPIIGARILEIYGAPVFLVEAVRHHHEAFNGRGYPDHLAGEEIPLAARLLAVADVFDALTSERPYKAGMDAPQACERIQSGADGYFDPEVVAAFLALVDGWPAFILPRHACPVPPKAPARLNIWYHELMGE